MRSQSLRQLRGAVLVAETAARSTLGKTLVIPTSPYSDSHLPM
jgi:hypothetical protein